MIGLDAGHVITIGCQHIYFRGKFEELFIEHQNQATALENFKSQQTYVDHLSIHAYVIF